MNRNALSIIVVFGLVFLATPGSALKCYNCTSQNNEQCADPLNVTWHLQTHHIRTCEDAFYRTPYSNNERSVCRKIVKKEGGGGQTVIRQCWRLSADEPKDGPCGPNSISSHEQSSLISCHFCSTDLCNSATSASPLHLLYATTLAALIYGFLSSKFGVV